MAHFRQFRPTGLWLDGDFLRTAMTPPLTIAASIGRLDVAVRTLYRSCDLGPAVGYHLPGSIRLPHKIRINLDCISRVSNTHEYKQYSAALGSGAIWRLQIRVASKKNRATCSPWLQARF